MPKPKTKKKNPQPKADRKPPRRGRLQPREDRRAVDRRAAQFSRASRHRGAK